MELIHRSKDIISNDAKIERLFTFTDFPVFLGCVDHAAEEDLRCDMDWDISRQTGIIQLANLLPLDVLYQEQHSSVIGRIWEEHHQAFSEFFIENTEPGEVLEIGGAHGMLSKNVLARNEQYRWTILEPNPKPADGVSADYVEGFLDSSFSFDRALDYVVHSHTWEHSYEPANFIGEISRLLNDGKGMLFSVPNLEVWLEKKYNNCLNFEHTVFLTEPYIEFLLSTNGFAIIRKDYFQDDHSIFYLCERDSSVAAVSLSDRLYQKNKGLYLDYIEYHKKLISKLNSEIESLGDQPVYLFGAHVFAQYLIGFGLNTDRIVCLLDNDPNKQGRRLYGTSLKVSSPKILKDIENPAVILKAGVYNEEIKRDIELHINPRTRFLE